MSVIDYVWLPVFDPYTEVWMEKRFRARTFELPDGTIVRLLTMGPLSEVLCRTRTQIHAWLKRGLLPRPLFVVKGTKSRHWFSEKQIRMMHEAQREALGDNPRRANNQHANHARFFELARSGWRVDLANNTGEQ